ncbi:MotE family protein [Bacillus massiliglaciei]|uniref:MotE family protein n=1 Tax=Bacillus massiliglaciei TaxID=1816693 RepID=UPI000A9017E5|nr:MotE family protein [Bacillus massiliglaciei]
MGRKPETSKHDPKESTEKKAGKFQWFLFVFVIPIFFLLLVTGIVLHFAGFDIADKSKETLSKIPFTQDENQAKTNKDQTPEQYEKNVQKLEEDLGKKNEEIKKLENIIDTKDQSISKLEAEKDQLKKQQAEEADSSPEKKEEDTLKEITRTYETMSAKKAAPILSQMSEEEALKILGTLKAQTLAKILEQMPPEDAAKFTKGLTAKAEGN